MIEINDYVRKVVTTKTSLMLGKCGIGVDDLEDIEQELYLEVLEKSHTFDPDKGMPSTFIQCILQNKIADILSRKKTELMCRSFAEAGEALDDLEEAQFIDQSHSLEMQELSIDVRNVVDSLAPELRCACELLGRGERVIDIARKVGVKRSTFYYRVINPLRKAFKENGLKIYAENF